MRNHKEYSGNKRGDPIEPYYIEFRGFISKIFGGEIDYSHYSEMEETRKFDLKERFKQVYTDDCIIPKDLQKYPCTEFVILDSITEKVIFYALHHHEPEGICVNMLHNSEDYFKLLPGFYMEYLSMILSNSPIVVDRKNVTFNHWYSLSDITEFILNRTDLKIMLHQTSINGYVITPTDDGIDHTLLHPNSKSLYVITKK